MSLPAYGELHCLSNFSFLRGASHPEELVRRAAELGYSALAITDECSLAGVARAHAAARGTALKLILGSEFVLSDGFKFVLLARDRASYGRLSRLITHARMESPKGKYHLTRGDLESRLPEGCLALWLPDARADIGDGRWLRGLFGDRVWIGVELLLSGRDEDWLAFCRRLGDRTGLPLTACGDVHMHSRGRRALQDVLTAVRLGRPLHELGYALFPNGERHLRPRAVLARLYPAELLAETVRISAEVNFSLEELRYEYPDEIVPAGHTPASWLRVLTEEGARRRWPGGTPDSVAQLIEHELKLIADLKYEPYFLTVHDIVRHARELGILCQGRGSAANSAVCFCLGITEVDPARMNLLMERFISRERNEPPDIDVDFEHERREEVIQYIYNKYGRGRAALAASVITYRLKSAVRDVGKALGLSLDQVDRLAKQLAWWDRVERLEQRLLAAGFDPENPKIRQLIILAATLDGFPRHLSQHTGGFVIASRDLAALVPIENAAMADRTVIQWDKDDLESLGLIKVDVLALGMLTAIRKTLDYIADCSGRRWTLADIPAEDPDTYAMIRRADTVGVFQIESRAQMSMLPRLKPENFYDLVIEVAIVRPGPIQGDMVHPYLERRKHPERVEYPSHALKKVLERTLGVPIFQEQAMQIAMVAADFSAGEADGLRRAMAAWKKRGGLEPFEERLKAGMARNGYAPEFAERVYNQLRGFGEYGFPECVVGETRVVDADTGRWLTINEMRSRRVPLGHTLACDGNLRLQKRRVLAVIPSGIKQVWRLRTALGHTIVATAEHPFMTINGWRQLGALQTGDFIAVARSVPAKQRHRWPRHEILVLADLITEGNLCHPSTFYFYTTVAMYRDEFVKAVEQFPNTCAVVARHRNCFSVHVRRIDRKKPIGAVEWARELGIWGHGARGKYLPEEVFGLCDSNIALLIARLWEGDGGFSSKGHASYDTASFRLASEVQHLLLRLGIVSRLYCRRRTYRGRRIEHYVVTVTGDEPLRRYWRQIGRRLLDPDKRRKARVLARRRNGRMSRDIVPVEVREIIRRKQDTLGLTWVDIGEMTDLCMREIQSRCNGNKKGFRRAVIGRLARSLRSHELLCLANSDIYWDEVVSIDAVGREATYDLKIEGDHNFLANNLVVHNSHAASFALLTYVSSWLKCHEPAAFTCGLLNSQPMGFYTPSQLVQDAQRHGVEVRPVDVRYSDWDCRLEKKKWGRSEFSTGIVESWNGGKPGNSLRPHFFLRLGFRMVKGLAQEAAERIVAERSRAPFTSLQEMVERCGLDRGAVSALAAADALQCFATNRYQAYWQAAGIEPRPPLFPALHFNEATPLLGRPGDMEDVIADYNSTGLSLKDHPVALLRSRFEALHVCRAVDLEKMGSESIWKNGVGVNFPIPRHFSFSRCHGKIDSDPIFPTPTPFSLIKVAGLIVCRQRPDTASGVMFMTLEDETGSVNLIVWPKVLERQRQPLLQGQLLLVQGTLQREEDVIHVVVGKAKDYSGWLAGLDVRSRNFADGIRTTRA